MEPSLKNGGGFIIIIRNCNLRGLKVRVAAVYTYFSQPGVSSVIVAFKVTQDKYLFCGGFQWPASIDLARFQQSRPNIFSEYDNAFEFHTNRQYYISISDSMPFIRLRNKETLLSCVKNSGN